MYATSLADESAFKFFNEDFLQEISEKLVFTVWSTRRKLAWYVTYTNLMQSVHFPVILPYNKKEISSECLSYS